MRMTRNLRRWLGIGAAGLAVVGAGAAVAVASTAGGDPAPGVQEAPAAAPAIPPTGPAAGGPSPAGGGGAGNPSLAVADPGPGHDPELQGADDEVAPEDAHRDEGDDPDEGREGAGDQGVQNEVGSDRADSRPAAVSVERASATALAQAPGGRVNDVEREVEHGLDAYGISVTAPDGRELEVSVDVQTGEVVYIGEDD